MIKTPGFRSIKQNKNLVISEEPIFDKPPKNIRELIELFLNYNPKLADGKLVTILTRYVVPSLGGKSPKSLRATPQEKEDALSFLGQKSLSILCDLGEKLERYLEQEKVQGSKKYNIKYVVKSLVSWAETHGMLNGSELEKDNEIIVFRHTRVNLQDDNGTTYTREGEPGKFQQLGMPEDFVAIEKPTNSAIKRAKKQILEILLQKPTKKLSIALLSIPLDSATPELVLANRELEQEIESFVKFSRNKLKRNDTTIEGNVREFLRILNWMKTRKSFS
ncbi:MAG TPA: hypothetical protein V6D26_28350, partial [Stenomitos sp.]